MDARGDARGGSRIQGGHQGAADHARGRRHPLAERRAAPGTRPLRLHPPRALFPGCRGAGEGAAEGRHRDLPREHRGRLLRHRVQGGLRRRREAPDVHRDGVRQEDPPAVGHRHQADVGVRLQAPHRDGDQVRPAQSASVGDDDAQGEHHEVHRGRLPRLGLRARAREVRRARGHRGATRSRRRQGARRRGGAQGPHRGLDVPADPAAPRGILGRRVAEPQWRLHLRRAGGGGRRARHRAGRERRRRGRRVRGDARHRAEVRGEGQDQSGQRDPVRRDDAGAPRVGRGGQAHRRRPREGDRGEDQMPGATEVSTSGFGDAIIKGMDA
jgi:hypothetical protein